VSLMNVDGGASALEQFCILANKTARGRACLALIQQVGRIRLVRYVMRCG
jgi:hypothetical protein